MKSSLSGRTRSIAVRWVCLGLCSAGSIVDVRVLDWAPRAWRDLLRLRRERRRRAELFQSVD
jgi:hypothetical protein